ncbi:polyphosphate kinase 1 [Anoxybacterium hadale]|uniref:Polyphosphate kinase 1 n=1 Tax=Anoxybacterium hadale TaxID=3408580 RepID=A0ACD1AC40_9FIRM|nr:polyphosphate kinase 1 [Clostridiales bacterium]
MDHKDCSANQYLYMQNRELSWLRFNERVLQEAQDPEVPLLERMKFITIFSRNLDEFFMIRVGSLSDLAGEKEAGVDNKTGMTARQQLDQIYEAVRPLYLQRDLTYFDIRRQLKDKGICHLSMKDLSEEENQYLSEYFLKYILPILSPQIVDNHHPFPFIPNKKGFMALQLEHKNKDLLGLIPIPETIPELIFLPSEETRFLPSVRLIREYAHMIFNMYPIKEKVLFYVTRNADLTLEDEDIDIVDDFRSTMKKLLKKRSRLEIVRLETEQKISGWLKETLKDKLNITQNQIYCSRSPIAMNFDSQISAVIDHKLKAKLYYRPFKPQASPMISGRESILAQAVRKDLLLTYPYESMEPFLRMIREAAYDPGVISIKITIYRLANKTKLVEYLCAAAENGKEVVVLIELRARFDEQNNIDWSERLEESGCRLIYGIGEYKVHSKLCLITRKIHGEYQFITQVGTGNYNEKTTELYTDFSLITANQDIGKDASDFFKNMTISNLRGEYFHLLAAPFSMKSKLIELIEEEAAKKEEGRIAIKVNSVTDVDLINKLREASCAGVKITMIVRGICCILPGVPGETENIHIVNIVGRFLEHSRIFRFGIGKEQKLYISSADLMTRNMQRRVEIACPIYSEEIRDRINEIFDSMLYDTEKARIMQKNGTYKRQPDHLNEINIQELFIEKAKAMAAATPNTDRKRKDRLLPFVAMPILRLNRYFSRLIQ